MVHGTLFPSSHCRRCAVMPVDERPCCGMGGTDRGGRCDSIHVGPRAVAWWWLSLARPNKVEVGIPRWRWERWIPESDDQDSGVAGLDSRV